MTEISYPKIIGIELVRGCNFRCRMCPVTAHHKGEIQFMSLNTLQIILDKLKAESIKPEVLWLFHYGEAMLHPQFREFMQMVFDSQIFKDTMVVMHTNASLLTGDKAQAILDIPLIKKLVFSFDGFGDEESYRMLRGDHYDLVLKNISEFSKQAKIRRPDLIMETCTIIPQKGEVPGLAVEPLEKAKKNLNSIFEPMGVKAETRYMHDYSGQDHLEISGKKLQVYGGCTLLEQNSLYITYNGLVMPCCNVYDTSYNIGSILEQSPLEIVNSEKLSRLRHEIRMDNRASVDMCKACTMSIGGSSGMAETCGFWDQSLRSGKVTDISEAYHLNGIITDNKINQLDDKIEDSIDKVKIDALRQMKQMGEMLSSFKTIQQECNQKCDKLEMTCNNLNAVNNTLRCQIQSLSCTCKNQEQMICMLVREQEQKRKFSLKQKLHLFDKRKDLYKDLVNDNFDFMDGLIFNQPKFDQRSLVELSYEIPHKGYCEYKVCGYGESIHFFVSGSFGAGYIVEVVQNSRIIKQQLFQICESQHQKIAVPHIRGIAYVRFSAVGTCSTMIRVLEIVNPKGVFARKTLASYID